MYEFLDSRLREVQPAHLMVHEAHTAPQSERQKLRQRGISFFLQDDLLYHGTNDGYTRLCIPEAMTDRMMESAHGMRNHFSLTRMLKDLEAYSIRGVTQKVRKYVAKCKACCLGQTDRDQKIGSYKPVPIPPKPMQTIGMDFITDMPPTPSADFPWKLASSTLQQSERKALPTRHPGCSRGIVSPRSLGPS